MPYTTLGKNALLDYLGTQCGFVALSTADTPDFSVNEVTGGTPAYARKAITWNAATGGALDSSNQPVFDVPSGTTVRSVGVMDAGVVNIADDWANANVTDEAFGAQGTYTLTDVDLDLNA